MQHTHERGYLLLLSIVYGAVFLAVLGGLTMFVLGSNKLQTHNTSKTQAFALAEAGLEYYRWFLSHYPNDFTNGTGVPGPYTLTYNDPEGGTAGTISLQVTPNVSCGVTTSVDLSSTGYPVETPYVSRTVHARYAQPSVGTYSYILNDSVWAGADRVINGPYHSNGGVHMDGTANAEVTSSLATWNCTSTYGCSPAQPTASGVFGSGPNQTLWQYPVPQVDFGAISADFGALKTIAQSAGTFYDRYSTTNGQGDPAYWRGYHVIFNANGTITIRKVSSTTQLGNTPVNSADDTTDRALINNEAAFATVTLPSGCGLIYIEDNVWIEGTVSGKITLVAANVANANISPNVYIRNNIQYATGGGVDGLTVIAEHNVLIAPDAPNSMNLNGIFIAQDGAFGMNAYNSCTYASKTGTLTITGTTVSNKRTGTKWTSTCGGYYKGYQTRVDSYDRYMAYDPPPFTPLISEDYQFISWREE